MPIISGGSVMPDVSDDTYGIYTFAGAPTNGTSGTLAGVIPKGGVLVDTTNAILYINTNTRLSPTFTKVGTQT